jgi:branched-chain amino acid transport system permease protein
MDARVKPGHDDSVQGTDPVEDVAAYLHFVLLPQVVDALIIGVALALVALGLTMIFGLLDVINLAHGELYMLGGYATFTLLGWGAGYWSALVLVPLLVGLVGWALEELGIRPLLPRADRAIVTLLLTFGVSLILRDVAQVVWGTETRSVAPPLAGITNVAEVFVPTYRIFVFAVGLLAIALTWFLVYRTRIGAVLRATAVDPTMVASFGIPVRLVYGFTFLYGCGLAGLAGVLLSPIYAVFPTMGHDFLVMAFAVVIVGGMGSIVGAVVAALLLAQVQGIASLWIPPVWAETLVYGVMLLVLVVRPGGLFNRLGEA